MRKYIKSISEFILEQKIYIFQRKFRIDDLISYNLYSPITISRWMSLYRFDRLAHAMLVSKDKIKVSNNILSDMRVSSKDLVNKTYFNDDVRAHIGTLIEDSLINIDGNEVYLFVFTKNSDLKNRSRQIHGFIYEYDVRRLNNLSKLSYIDKWDARGGLDKRFLENRLGKQIEFFDGSEYINIVDELQNINWDILPSEIKKGLYWNIKCSKIGSGIDTADFKRVFGLTINSGDIVKFNSKIENFIFVVGFHDGNGIIVEEYIILMPISTWETYIPNISDPEVLLNIKNMYYNLKRFKLIGERSLEVETEWQKFIREYSKITENTIVKLRFKRDTKGQLRIQSGISNSNFKEEILKNKHIKIK